MKRKLSLESKVLYIPSMSVVTLSNSKYLSSERFRQSRLRVGGAHATRQNMSIPHQPSLISQAGITRLESSNILSPVRAGSCYVQ